MPNMGSDLWELTLVASNLIVVSPRYFCGFSHAAGTATNYSWKARQHWQWKGFDVEAELNSIWLTQAIALPPVLSLITYKYRHNGLTRRRCYMHLRRTAVTIASGHSTGKVANV